MPLPTYGIFIPLITQENRVYIYGPGQLYGCGAIGCVLPCTQSASHHSRACVHAQPVFMMRGALREAKKGCTFVCSRVPLIMSICMGWGRTRCADISSIRMQLKLLW